MKKISTKYSHLKLSVLNNEFSYVLLKDVELNLSQYVSSLETLFMFKTLDEFSIIVSTEDVEKIPKEYVEKVDSEWVCLRIIGDMPFGTVQGLLASITSSLFDESQIGSCVISTFKSDFFFIKKKNLNNAKIALSSSGWSFVNE